LRPQRRQLYKTTKSRFDKENPGSWDTAGVPLGKQTD